MKTIVLLYSHFCKVTYQALQFYDSMIRKKNNKISPIGICCVIPKMVQVFFLSNVGSSPDSAIFVTFETFKFAAENHPNVQRRDWTRVKLSSQSKKENFPT